MSPKIDINQVIRLLQKKLIIYFVLFELNIYLCIVKTKKVIKQNIMETSKINKLNRSESYDIECALSHILARYSKHSRPVANSDYRVLDSVSLSADEVAALLKLHDIIYNKLYVD